jgi:PAS domain S-box-containing protein
VENLANQLMEETGNIVIHQLNENLEIAKLANRTNTFAIRAGYIDGFNLKTVEPHYVEQLRLMPRLSALGLINEKREFLAVERPRPHSLIIRRFKPTGTDWGLYRYFAEQNGKNLALQDIRRNYDPHNDPPGNPWYEKARRSPNGTWRLTVTLAMGQDAPMLQLIHALPFNNANGKFSGVLAASFYLTQLGDFLKNLQISKTGQVFLIEQDGLLVATSTGEVPFDRQRRPNHAQNVAVKHRRLSSLQSQNPLTRAAATYLLTSQGQATDPVFLNQSQSASFWFKHQRYFVRTVPLPGELNWLAIVVVPESDFTQAIEINNAKTAFLSWLTLFVATGLGILTSRWIAKPILRLSQASRALAQGEWQQSLKEDSPITELKTLTTSFNQTAEQLQRSFDRTKLALYESQDKFAKIFRTSPDAVNIVSMEDGTYVEVNEQFVQVTGYLREEVIGHTALELNLLAELEQALQLGEMLQTGKPIRNLEIKLRTRAGQIRTGLMSSELLDLEGQRCVLSIFKDVSDRKRAEEALRQSEMALQEAQRVARVGSWEYDLATGTTVWSKELYRIHQCDPDQPPPSAEEFVNRLHPEDRVYYQAFGEQLLQGRAVEQDFRIRLQDGSLRYIATKGEPVLDAEGKVVRLVGTVLDITDRKQLELALEASRAQLNNVLNSAIAAIVRMLVFPDCTWQVQHISAGSEFISGYTPEELINRSDLWTSRILPEDWQAIECQLFEDIFAERTGTYEYRFCHKDGDWRWFSQANSSQRDITRNCWVVTMVVTDISDRKQAEQALRESEARFQKVTDAAPGEIYILLLHPDGSYEFEYMSPACRDIQELEPEQILQYPELSFEQVHPDDRAGMYTCAAESAATLQPFSHEWRIITPSGQVKWVQVSARPERRENGDIAWYGVLQDISDRKQAEAALRQSEERFQKLATASPGIIYTVVEYPDGPVRYEYLSPAFEEVHEVPVANALQDPTITLQQIHPDDRAGYQQAVAESLAAMQPFKHEWRIITPSGKTKWIQASSRPERRENGEIAWHGVVVDVTDRKQAEAKLEQAIQQIDSHFENSPLAIMQWDQHYRVLRWSKQAEQIFGWTAAEVIHRAWLDWNFVYEADLEYVNTSIAPLLNGAVSNISIQNRNYTKDGRVITCQWYTSVVFNEAGKVVSVLSFAQDISDRLQAELELTKAHDLREAIFNEATDAIFLVEAPPHRLILDCNQCAVEMFEVDSKADLIGIEGNTLQKTQFTTEELAAIGAEMMQKGYWSREIEYVTRKGHVFWGNLAAKPIQVGGQMMQLVRLTDISDRHELDRIKDEFISIVSHELRTPLTAIRGSLGILETGILNEEPDTAHHMLQVAVRNSDRLVRLVNDILDLERLESGKVQLVMEPCWVSDLMEMALEGVQAIAAEADITLHSSPIHAQVCAAPDAIVQAFTNLLGNAIKFSSPGGMVWLKAEIGNGERGTPYLLFSIKDQGRGIPADKLDNIFGRFQQVDVSDARQKGGTGLGLAICKSIIQQHGGQIWVESVLGQGSTFYFTLPLQQDQEGKGEWGVGNPDHNDE